MKRPRTLEQAAADVLERTTETPEGCLIWTGALLKTGYGRIFFGGGGGRRMTHRVVYEAKVGPIPEGMIIDHLCHSRSSDCAGGRSCVHRACVNPAHLEAVSPLENVRRGVGPRKTHCVNGHALDEDNVYRASRGFRACRTCRRQRSIRRAAVANARRRAAWAEKKALRQVAP